MKITKNLLYILASAFTITLIISTITENGVWTDWGQDNLSGFIFVILTIFIDGITAISIIWDICIKLKFNAKLAVQRKEREHIDELEQELKIAKGDKD